MVVIQAQDGREIWWDVHETFIQKALLTGWRKSEEYRIIQKVQVPAYKGWQKNLTGNNGTGKSFTISSHIQSAICTACGMYQEKIAKIIGIKTSQTRRSGWGTAHLIVSDDLLSHLVPTFILLRMSQNIPGLTTYKFQQGSLLYQNKFSVQAVEILLDVSF